MTKKEGKEADAAPVEEPAAPAMPSMKASQVLPMIVMLGLQKFDLEKLGYKRHVEAAFVVAQIVCLCLIFFVYKKIEDAKEGSVKLKIPEVKQFGQVVAPSKECTPKEYDMTKLQEQAKQALMSFCILGGVYYKWGYLLPLVLQIFMTPMQLYESPLFQIHILGKTVTRPFATPNPFGLPEAPPAAAEAVVDEPAKADKKEVKDAKEPKEAKKAQ